MNIITLLTLSIIIIIIIIIIIVIVHAVQHTCIYMIMQEILVPSTGGNKILQTSSQVARSPVSSEQTQCTDNNGNNFVLQFYNSQVPDQVDDDDDDDDDNDDDDYYYY